MSTFTNYDKWKACVEVRFPNSDIQEWAIDGSLIGASAFIPDVRGDIRVAGWIEDDGRGFVNPVITSPFGSMRP